LVHPQAGRDLRRTAAGRTMDPHGADRLHAPAHHQHPHAHRLNTRTPVLTVTSAQLDAWIAALLFPLTRVLALLAAAPVLGPARIPARVRIGLAVGLVIVLAPTLPPPPPVAPASAAGML